MSFQTDVEAISIVATGAASYSANALADAGATSPIQLPDNTVLNLDGVVVKVLFTGTTDSNSSASLYINGAGGVSVSSGSFGSNMPFVVELTGVWFSSLHKFIWYVGNIGSGGSQLGYNVTATGVSTGVTLQEIVFSASAGSIGQLTAKLA